jgi:hypothetical protein
MANTIPIDDDEFTPAPKLETATPIKDDEFTPIVQEPPDSSITGTIKNVVSKVGEYNKAAGEGIIRNTMGLSKTLGSIAETALGAGTGLLSYPAGLVGEALHSFDKGETYETLQERGKKIGDALTYTPKSPEAQRALEQAFYIPTVALGMMEDAADLVSESRGVPKSSAERRRGQIAGQVVGLAAQGKLVKPLKYETSKLMSGINNEIVPTVVSKDTLKPIETLDNKILPLSTLDRRRRKLVTDLEAKQAEQVKLNNMLRDQRDETNSRVIIDEPNITPLNTLDAETKAFVDNKVAELNDPVKVRELYSTDSAVDVYAREKANELQVTNEPLPVQNLNKVASDYKTEAESLGATFNGMQERVNKSAIPLFTDKKTGATFSIKDGETLQQALENKRKEFQSNPNRPLSDNEFKELVDTKVFTPEELDIIKKLPADKQRNQYNRTFDIIPKVEYTPESIAKAQEVFAKVSNIAKFSKSKIADINTLKKQGFSDDEITKMTDSDIRRKANAIDGKVNTLNPNTEEIAKLSEVDTNIAKLNSELKGVPIDKITPDQEARLEEVTRKISEELDIDELTDTITNPKMKFGIDEFGNTTIDIDPYYSRGLDIASRAKVMMANKISKEEVSKKYARRRPTSVKETQTEEHIPNEDLSTINEIGTPVKTRAEELALDRARKTGSADDWEATLAAEGMPSELRFDEKLSDFLKLDKQKTLETWNKVSTTIDDINNRRKFIHSSIDARNLLTDANQILFDTRDEALAWHKKVTQLEDHVSYLLDQRRSAFSRKEIAKAVDKKWITKEEALYMNNVFSLLKQQPTFDFKYDPKLGIRTDGLYSFAANLIKVKNPYALAHEVIHFAYDNVLTKEDRFAYRESFIENYYDKDGNLLRDKLRLATTDPFNTTKSPVEAFACKGADLIHDKIITPTEYSLYTKVRDWFAKLKDKLINKGGDLKFNDVDKLFEKILNTDESRNIWTEGDSGEPAFSERAYNYDSYTKWSDNITRIHPATYPKSIQKLMSDIANKLNITEVLDIFGGVGKIGKMRDFGYTGNIKAIELEPSWGGKDTIKLHKDNGVDESIVGDSRNLPYSSNSIQAIFTSPTYGNLMALKSPSKKDSYQAFAGGKLTEGNTGGEVWGPVYEQLHKDIYKEAYRVIQPGGYFVLNMKDKPVSASDIKNNWIPKKGSTVEVKDQVMKATDWHIKALKEVGFKVVKKIRIDEAAPITNTHKLTRKYTVGYEDVIVLKKEVSKPKEVTLDMLGFQNMYERSSQLLKIFSKAKADDNGRRILAEVKDNDWGLAEELKARPVISLDDTKISERIYRNLGPWIVSPMVFAKGTRLERHVYNANLSEMYISHMFDQHNTTINAILHDLKKGNGVEENVRKVIEGKIEGNSAEQAAAAKVRDWLDTMKNRYKATLLNEYKDNLSKREYNALLDIISGSTKEEVMLKYPKLDSDTINSIADKFNEINTWGLDNYIPNMEAGRFKILAEDTDSQGRLYKHVVAIGLSEKDAARKASKYLEDNPDVKELYVDTDYKMISDDKTRVTRGQYFGMMNSLAKKMMESIDNIDKGVAKNMAAATLKRKFKIIPTDSYSPFLEERLNILKGEENIFPVLKSYAHSMEKKMSLDLVIDLIRNDLPKMNKFEKKYMLDYIEDVKGHYGVADQMVDDIFRTYRGYSRLVSRARTTEANLKLGYRPVAAAVNLASGQMHAWVKRGTPIYLEGVKFLRSEEGKKLIADIEPFLGTSIIDSGTSISSKTPSYKPLGLFQKPEPLNREVSVACAYTQAIKPKSEGGFGMIEDAAKEFAIRANWAEQFTYNIANLPKLMRGPTGKLLTQFKPYLVKEIEFMSTLSGKEWARYLAMQLTLGGPRGYMLVLKTLPILATFSFWNELTDTAEEWMNKNAPLASRGIAGLPGLIKPEYAFDISAASTFQFPSGPMDFVGPFISDLVNLKKNVIDPLTTYGPYAEDLKSSGDMAPIVRHWKRIIDYTFSEDNWLKDDKGNKLYKVPSVVPFILQSVAGVENVDLNRIKAEERILAQRDVRTRGLVTRLINESMKHILDGTQMPSELVDKMAKNGITEDTLKRRINNSNLPPDLRILMKTEIMRRPEVLEMFPEAADYMSSD